MTNIEVAKIRLEDLRKMIQESPMLPSFSIIDKTTFIDEIDKVLEDLEYAEQEMSNQNLQDRTDVN